GGAKVSSATAFFLEGMQAVNRRIRELAASGAIAPDAAGPGTRGQLSHLVEEVLRSAMTGHALQVDARTIEALTGSSSARDQARLDAFWKVYPDVRWAAERAALAPPVILSTKEDVVTAGAADTLAVPPDRRPPPVIDER